MGVSWHHVNALLDTYQSGASFEKTLTLGRLNLFISPWELKPLLADARLQRDFDQFMSPYPRYAEPLFRLLGAHSVESLDVSAYEGATVIHDLNQPLPEHLKSQFDLVDDGGTLEHVFNFTTALKSCMEAVKIGGHLLVNTVANNHLGHGFYQFSPELFYRALSPANGFEVERLVLYPTFDSGRWYDVPDPDSARRRVELVSDREKIGLWVRARRVSQVPIFDAPPQQSDYQNFSWKSKAEDNEARPNKFLNPPNSVKRGIRQAIQSISPSSLYWLRQKKERRKNTKFVLEAQGDLYKPARDK